jgi:hypothetical protein
LAAGFIVARLHEAAAGTAIDEKGVLGLGRVQIAEAGGAGARCVRQSLLAVLSRCNCGVLKSLALLRGCRRAWSGPIARRAASSASVLAILPSSTASASPISGLSRWGRGRRAGDSRHFDGPVLETRLRADRDLLMDGRETKHFDPNIPYAWRQVQSIASGVVGIGRDFGIALDGVNGGAGQKLVGCANGAALLSPREERHYQENDG